MLPCLALLSCASAPPPAAVAPCVAPPASATPPAPAHDTLVHAADLTFAVNARPFANLSYHLDCLSGRLRCEQKAFHAFWDPGWTGDDKAALDEWKVVHDRYDVSAKLGGDAGPTPLPLPDVHVSFDDQLRIAGLAADTLDDYAKNLRILLPGTDAERMRAAAAHFLPRFLAFWSATGDAVGSRYRADVEALFTHGDLAAIVSRAAHFYGTPLPKGAVIDFDLIVVPTPSKHSNGQQLGSHGVIEIFGDEAPRERIDVVCHELFHYFYASRTSAQQAALMKRIFDSGDALAEIAYSLLDESVATALGNGVVARSADPGGFARRVQKDLGLYNDHAIDATAKGLLSRAGTEGDPTTGPGLDAPETVARLLAATRDAVGAEPAPLDYLKALGGAAEHDWFRPVMDSILQRARYGSLTTSDLVDVGDVSSQMTEHSALPFVLVLPTARARALPAAGYRDAIAPATRTAVAALARQPGPFAFAARRTPASWLFVIVGDTPADAKRAAEALFSSKTVKEGVTRP